ncbi:hypothetical protein WJX74_009592 [Apatococcus lobatus]|uniref:U-box domain-containing protein n=1 Tax=Apatococcus lobatus TaxID=904363 RepID=A0AAW1RT82_9CHLO
MPHSHRGVPSHPTLALESSQRSQGQTAWPTEVCKTWSQSLHDHPLVQLELHSAHLGFLCRLPCKGLLRQQEQVQEALDLSRQLQQALSDQPARTLSQSIQAAESFGAIAILLQSFTDSHSRGYGTVVWDDRGCAILEQLLDVLHSGISLVQQTASFCRLRAYISMQSLAMALSATHGNVLTCLHGLAHLPNLPKPLGAQILTVTSQPDTRPLAVDHAHALTMAALHKCNDLHWNGSLGEAECHSRMDDLISEVFPDGFDIPELRACISDLAQGAGEEHRQKEHRQGHLLMQLSRVVQKRYQLATSRTSQSVVVTPFSQLAPTPSSGSSGPPAPPREYICPISGQPMSDPVLLAETGMTYDRASIQEWLDRGQRTCPLTHQQLRTGQMVPIFALKGLIETWAARNGVDLPSSPSVSRQEMSMQSSNHHPVGGLQQTTTSGQKHQHPQLADAGQTARTSDAPASLAASFGGLDLHASPSGVSQDKVLWEAALAGSSRDLLLAIRRGGNMEWQDASGKTPLLCAAAAGHPAIVQLLLDQGVQLEARDTNRDTVLHLAASQARLGVLTTLVSCNQAALPELLSSCNAVGNTPLHCAASIGNTACVQTLLHPTGTERHQTLDMRNHLGSTPLHVAAQQGHSAVVQLLLQAGAKCGITANGGLTPLHNACSSGDAATVSALVKAGAKRNAADQLDRQPIDLIGCHQGMEASQHAQESIIELLTETASSAGTSRTTEIITGRHPLSQSSQSDTYQEGMSVDRETSRTSFSRSTTGTSSIGWSPWETSSTDLSSRTGRSFSERRPDMRRPDGRSSKSKPPALPSTGNRRLDKLLEPLVEAGAMQTHLDLSWQKLNKDETKAVGIMLLHNTSLTHLNFRGNKPTRRGIKPLSQALTHNRTLTSLDLGETEMDHDSATLLAQSLSTSRLTHLSLWNVQLGNERARPILQALHANTHLLSLDLGSNQLGPEAGPMLSSLLGSNQTLQTLDLRLNRLGKSGIAAIAEGCMQNSSLRDLLLNNNGMPVFGLSDTKNTFKARKSAVNLRVVWS